MKNKKHAEGFGVPKGYFLDFEERLFNKLNEAKLPKGNGFTVPQGYFKAVEEKIINDIENTSTTPKVISIISRKTWLYAASIAASAIIIFSIIPSDKNTTTINDIEIANIESYIDEGNLIINTTDLTAMLDDEDITLINSEIESFSDELLEKYLLENIDDSSIIIE